MTSGKQTKIPKINSISAATNHLLNRNKEINSFSVITKVDMKEMAFKHLPDFDLIRARPKANLGKEYVFFRESDTACVYITISLHQSGENAENITNNYLKYISVVFNEGPYQGVSIGDKFWWWAPFKDNSILKNIIFIRENAPFIMSCSENYGELKLLAQKINNDIIMNANYIELENTILLPVIDSITTSRKVLKEGETAKIIVYATDPNNEPLEYSNPGLVCSKSDPANVFTVIASTSYISAPFLGSHIYTFFVINESNSVSEGVEFEIQITE
jgi:hypothetical protein